MEPNVSICIPTYNGAVYLSECLDSILAQTYSDFEVLIVDDSSSDRTLEIAYAYQQKDKRIRVHRNSKNLGLVGNWNQCVKLSKGNWIKFVFQDDLMEKHCLLRMLEAGKANKPLIACHRNFIFDDKVAAEYRHFFENISAISDVFPHQENLSSAEFCEAIVGDIGHNFIGEPTCVMLKRDIFYELGYFNPQYIQLGDLEFFCKVGAAHGMTYISDKLATFRVHTQSTTAYNNNRRYYRARLVDPLILLHDFALQPSYTLLRQVAEKKIDRGNLLLALSENAYETKKYALDKPECMEEWANIVRLYPILEELSTRKLPTKLAYYLKSKKHLFETQSKSSLEVNV